MEEEKKKGQGVKGLSKKSAKSSQVSLNSLDGLADAKVKTEEKPSPVFGEFRLPADTGVLGDGELDPNFFEKLGSGMLPERLYSTVGLTTQREEWKPEDDFERESYKVVEAIRKANEESKNGGDLIIDTPFSNEDIIRPVKVLVPDTVCAPGVRLTSHRFVTFMERVDRPLWTDIKITGELDSTVFDSLLSYLEYYPDVVDALIDWFKNPEQEIKLIESLVSDRIKWGRETYREGNFKFSTSELIRAVSSKFSSWKKNQGKELLSAILVQIIASDIKKTHWLKHDCDYHLPIRNVPLDNVRASFHSMKQTALKKILSSYFVLASKFAENALSGADNVFGKGTTMLNFLSHFFLYLFKANNS